jgi:hypothetical protein
LYGCKDSSDTLEEEHWLRVFENRVLRRIFGPKRKEVTGGCIMRNFVTFTFTKHYLKLKKGKVVPVLFLNRAPGHEGVLGEWRYRSAHSSTSALHRGKWSASRPGCFIPKERAPGTHWIGGWVGPRAVLDVVLKKKILSPHRESNPRTPRVQPVA